MTTKTLTLADACQACQQDWVAITQQARECRARGDLDAAATWTEMADELIDTIGARDCD